MTSFWIENSRLVIITAVLLFTCGLHCILFTHNQIRILIGIELLTKAVTLLLVLGGAVTGRLALAQALIITLVVLEVVAIVVAAGIVMGNYRHHGTVNTDPLQELKG
jgi:NADH:ubiquinone oxidoreductase subunit K